MSQPGEYPTPMPGFSLVKTARSFMSPSEVGAIDVVLLSHDEHDDNLDHSGREFLKTVLLTVTTISGAGRLGGTAMGVEFWQSLTVASPSGIDVTSTGVPALHGPEGSEAVAGDCIGFLIGADGNPSIYVRGDNASML